MTAMVIVVWPRCCAPSGGWLNHKQVERLWRQQGLEVPQKQPKRISLWLADGSCVRIRPAYQKHVWSYEFVADRTSDGQAIRLLTLLGREQNVMHTPFDAVVIGMTTLLEIGHGEPICNLGRLATGTKASDLLHQRTRDHGLEERLVEELSSNVLVVDREE